MTADILNALIDGPRKPTHIAYRSNLSWTVLNQHLKLMVEKGLVRREGTEKRAVYMLTQNGQKVLSIYTGIRSGLGLAEKEHHTVRAPDVEIRRTTPVISQINHRLSAIQSP